MSDEAQSACNVYIKVHERDHKPVIGICDEELLGQVLKKDKFRFEVTPRFFKGQLIPIEKTLPILRGVGNFNAVGGKVIAFLINHHIIHEDAVLVINEVPVALKFLF